MKKMTFEEVCEKFYKYNEDRVASQFSDEERLIAVVVFKADNWPEKDYSEESRSYAFASDNKYFVPGMCGSSIYANNLDGTDRGVRLDWYLGEWKIDYCYIKEQK